MLFVNRPKPGTALIETALTEESLYVIIPIPGKTIDDATLLFPFTIDHGNDVIETRAFSFLAMNFVLEIATIEAG